MNKGELVHQVETPGVSYLDIALSADGKFTYAVGDDGLIKEISEGIVILFLFYSKELFSIISQEGRTIIIFLFI